MSWGETIFLRNIIKGEKRLVASEGVLAVIDDAIFAPKIDGLVKIKTIVTQTSSTSTGTYTLSIYEDGDLIRTVSAETYAKGEVVELFADIAVSKGAEYTATLKRSGGASWSNTPISVCGQVTDANYFDVVKR
jgi:hypothetical protein